MAKLCSVVFRFRSLVNVVVGWMRFEKNASKVFQRFFSEERWASTRTPTYRFSCRYFPTRFLQLTSSTLDYPLNDYLNRVVVYSPLFGWVSYRASYRSKVRSPPSRPPSPLTRRPPPYCLQPPPAAPGGGGGGYLGSPTAIRHTGYDTKPALTLSA